MTCSMCLREPWCFILVFVLLHVSDNEASVASRRLCNHMGKANDASARLVDFFGADTADVNVDGLFGLRAAEVNYFSVQRVASKQNWKYLCPSIGEKSFYKFFQYARDLTDINTEIYARMEEQNTKYFRQMQPILKKWGTSQFDYSAGGKWRSLPKSVIPDEIPKKDLRSANGGNYKEKAGDICFSKVMGTHPGKPKCTVEPDCLQFFGKMFDEGQGYELTHALLYLQLTEAFLCSTEQYPQLKVLKSKVEKSCGSMYRQFLNSIEEFKETNGITSPSKFMTPFMESFKYMKQDILIEQATVCGNYGYPEFLEDNALKLVLSWQRKSGCYGKQTSGAKQNTTAEAADSPVFHGTSRRLAFDQAMSDGCSSHSSGLAAEFLSLVLRHRFDALTESL